MRTNMAIAATIKLNARILKFPLPEKNVIPDKIKNITAMIPEIIIAKCIFS